MYIFFVMESSAHGLDAVFPSRAWCSCSAVPHLHAAAVTERMAFSPLPLNSPGLGDLSETISVIELSIWWFIYDKGVITQ